MGEPVAQVVQHDAGRAERHVPVVGLVEVVVQARRSQPAWRSPRLPWIISRPLREPLAAVGLDEEAALVAVDGRPHDVHAGDDIRLLDARHARTFYQPPLDAGAEAQSSEVAAPRK